MKFKASCSDRNRTLIRKNLSRFFPLLVLGTIVLILIYMNCGNMPYYYDSRVASVQTVKERYTETAFTGGSIFSLLYAIACAVCMFGYVNKRNQAYMLHAFPVTRGSLYRAGLVSGFLAYLIPLAIVTVLNMLRLAITTPEAIGTMLGSMGITVIEFSFFYAIALFSLMLTGNNVAAVFFYGFFNFFAVATESMLRSFFQSLLYGIPHNANSLTAFSPIVKLIDDGGYLPRDVEPLPYMLSVCGIYLAVLAVFSVFLFWAAAQLYRKRHVEAVGEVIVFRKLRPVFKYVLTFYGALAGGLLFNEIVNSRTDFFFHTGITLVLTVIGTAIGYYAAEMLLRRTVKVFKAKTLPGLGIVLGVLLLTVFGMKYDVFGYFRRVPDAEDVASVTVNYFDTMPFTLTSDEGLREVTELQRSVTEDHYHGSAPDTEGLDSLYYTTYTNLHLTYTLKSGTTLTREYYVSPQSELGQKISGFYRESTVKDAIEDSLRNQVSKITVEYVPAESQAFNYRHYEDMELMRRQIPELLDAVIADFKADKIMFSFDYRKTADETDSYPTEIYLYDSEGMCITMMYVPEDAVNTLAYLATLGIK